MVRGLTQSLIRRLIIAMSRAQTDSKENARQVVVLKFVWVFSQPVRCETLDSLWPRTPVQLQCSRAYQVFIWSVVVLSSKLLLSREHIGKYSFTFLYSR